MTKLRVVLILKYWTYSVSSPSTNLIKYPLHISKMFCMGQWKENGVKYFLLR